jgi:hypothetical protein
MWCAMAVGTCEAVKAYCIKYANERTALVNLFLIVKVLLS